MLRRQLLLLTWCLALAAAGAAPTVAPAAIRNPQGAKAGVAGDVIIIIRDTSSPSPSKSSLPVVVSPPGSSKPKELVLDSLEEAERLARSVKRPQPHEVTTEEPQQGVYEESTDRFENRAPASSEHEASEQHDAADHESADSSSDTRHSQDEKEAVPTEESSSSGDHDEGSSRQYDHDSGSSSSRDRDSDSHDSDDSTSYEEHSSRGEDDSSHTHRHEEEAEEDHSSHDSSQDEGEHVRDRQEAPQPERERELEHEPEQAPEQERERKLEPEHEQEGQGSDRDSSGAEREEEPHKEDSHQYDRVFERKQYRDADSHSGSDSSSTEHDRRSSQGSHSEHPRADSDSREHHSADDRQRHSDSDAQHTKGSARRSKGSAGRNKPQHTAHDHLDSRAEREYMEGLPGPEYHSPSRGSSDTDPMDPGADVNYSGPDEDEDRDSSSGSSHRDRDSSSSSEGRQDKDRDASHGSHSDRSREGGPGAYPKMEEPAEYYEQPELHTTCLQVVRAVGTATGPVTYDLRCCEARDDPKSCLKPPEPYSDSYSNKLKLRDVIRSAVKVGTCTFTPQTTPCPYTTAGACQAYTGSWTAADCGCPVDTGLILNVTAYARSNAALSCNPIFSLAYTPPRAPIGRRLLQVNYTDEYAPYLGVATTIAGAGRSPDGLVEAGITMVTGFGVPAAGPALGRRLLSTEAADVRKNSNSNSNSNSNGTPAVAASHDGNNVAKLAMYNLRRATRPRGRQLPTVFDYAPSAPIPLPDLPFVLGGRMIIEWSRVY